MGGKREDFWDIFQLLKRDGLHSGAIFAIKTALAAG